MYAAASKAVELRKRDRARQLLQLPDGALSAQVLQEFYVQATRPSRPERLSHDAAVGLIVAWSRFRVQPVTLRVVHDALRIKAAHHLSYLDSAIVAAARALGCDILYTENDGQVIDGVTIANPFR